MLAAVLGYCAIHAGFRLLASSSLGEDDPLENVLVQTLRLGYLAPQPALYDWALFAVQRLTGPGVGGFLLIKYAALTATALLLYLTALRVLRDWVWAALAVESMALIYQIAWRYHEGFTHAVGAMVAVAATVWVLMRVIERGRTSEFLLLGLIAGLGAMTEPTFWAFLAALMAASLVQPAIRARVGRPGLAMAAVVALALASPYVYWIATHPEPVTWVHPWSKSVIKNLGKGLLDAVRGPLFYLSPLIVIVPIVFPRALGIALDDFRRPPNRAAEPDLAQLILHTALAGMVLCLLGAVLLGLAGYAMHQLMPLYLPSVIWLMSVAQRASAGADAPRRRFAQVAAVIAVLALTARLANMFVLDPVCEICRWGIPYPGLAHELVKRGLAGLTIVSPDPETAGNLRVQIPSARIGLLGARGRDGATDSKGTGIVYVWPEGKAEEAQGRSVAAVLGDGRKIGDAVAVEVPWRHLWRRTGYRSSVWHVLTVPAGPGPQPQR